MDKQTVPSLPRESGNVPMNQKTPTPGGGAPPHRGAPESEPILAEVVSPPDNRGGAAGVQPAESGRRAEPLSAAGPRHGGVQWRETAALLLLIVLCDVTIYRGYGFAGYALLFALAPLGMLLGVPRSRVHAAVWIIGAMLVVLAANLLWCGSGLLVACGFALLVAFAMALQGMRPYVLDAVAYAFQVLGAGGQALFAHGRSAGKARPARPRGGLLSVLLPAAALLAFGTLFVLANPDLADSFTGWLRQVFNSLWEWIASYGPAWDQVLFWFAVAWIAAGLLRPVMRRSLLDRFSEGGTQGCAEPVRAVMFVPFRNTLVALIVLFAVYLVFEFGTLWTREFPEGFYYAGYAHEGAAWLTAALALATAVLSLIFRGSVLRDPRLPRLRRLTWIWSFENALLAAAVYNRLLIYIDFNGMTRMRTVGLYGMTVVVAGFALVVWKVARQRDFVWLLHRHLGALAITVYLFAVTPVDPMVHAYNARRILAGDLAPAVQISVHPIDSAGVLVLPPLVHCEDEIIREGIRAMLADRYVKARAQSVRRERHGWTVYQVADHLLLAHLGRLRPYWEPYTDPAKRREALDRFDTYVYRWY